MASSVVASSSSRARSALESFFTPASVAVIGAAEREGSVGRTVLGNLVHSSYRGQVVAVNPKHSELLGIKCYPGVATLPESVDLAGRVWNLDVVPECNDAHPVVVGADFVNLHADKRILAHPLNFPPQRGEAVQALGVVGEINWNDVGMVVGDAGQPAKVEACEHVATFTDSHLSDQHGRFDLQFPGPYKKA